MKKTSDHVEAARNKVIPAAEDFVHTAADRVGPLAQSAAERLGPLAHSLGDRVTPLAQSAATRVSPLAAGAAAAATATVLPLAHQAAGAVSPYAHQAAERLAPLADTAKQRGAHLAQGAVDKLGPALDDAFDRVGPAVDAARDKVSDDLLPKLTAALAAAAGSPVVVEAVNRGQATIAAAKGELALPPPKKKGSWVKRFAIVAAIAAVAYVVARRFLGSKDSDWQAARPTAPYSPPKPAAAPTEAAAEAATVSDDITVDSAESSEPVTDGTDDPQGGHSAHAENLEANGLAEPEQPAEGGEPDTATDEPEVTADEIVVDEIVAPEPTSEEPVAEQLYVEPATEEPAVDEAMSGDDSGEEAVAEEPVSEETAAPTDPSKYPGEGAYVGTEPPEGFFIKGNERSMKYHVPESSGYGRTIAEVWFNSEEAAQEAGFVRAQR